MIRFRKLFSLEQIQIFLDQYRAELIAPLDDMWEAVYLHNAIYYEIAVDGKPVGYYCVSKEGELLQFFLIPEFMGLSQTIFSSVLCNGRITTAYVSTVEPTYLALCLDYQKQVTVRSYLFSEPMKVEQKLSKFSSLTFELVSREQVDRIVSFYQSNLSDGGSWLRPYLENLIQRGHLFALYHQGECLGAGEYRERKGEKMYVNVGVVVANEHRRQGVATDILIRLATLARVNGQKPLCSCNAANLASKKAIENAGFLCKHRILTVKF